MTTLLEDLESFADACDSGDWGHLGEDAKRLRAHAKRIRVLAVEGNDGDFGDGIDHALLVVNGGPVPE